MTENIAIIAIGTIGASVLAFAAWRRPTFALVLWVISSVVLAEFVMFPNAATLHVHLIHFLLAGLLLGFGIGRMRSITPRRPELLMLGFMAWAIVSGCISGTIFREDGAENVRVLLSGFVIPILILYLARSTHQSLTTLRTACGALTVLLGYLVLTAFCEHFRITWLVFPQYILDPTIGIHAEKARGPALNAAENGGIMGILLIVALHRARYAFSPTLRWLVTVALLITVIPAMWFTQERGPWVALGAGLLILLLNEPRRGVVSALVAIAVIAIPLIASLQLEVLPQRPGTVEFRLGLYRESLDAFEKHPITGWGMGTFTNKKHLFDAYGPSSSLADNVQHDTIVAIATDTGAIGAILYVSFLVVLFSSLLRLRRSTLSSEKRDFYATSMAALTIFVVNGTFGDSRFWMPENALAFFIAGLALAIRHEVNRRPADRWVNVQAIYQVQRDEYGHCT